MKQKDKAEIKEVIRKVESCTGYDIQNKDEITDKQTAYLIITGHLHWFEKMADEAVLISRATMKEFGIEEAE